jgi:hypothetical protein
VIKNFADSGEKCGFRFPIKKSKMVEGYGELLSLSLLRRVLGVFFFSPQLASHRVSNLKTRKSIPKAFEFTERLSSDE